MYTKRKTGVSVTFLTPGGKTGCSYKSFDEFYADCINPGNVVHTDDIVWEVIDWDDGKVYQRGDRMIMNRWELENE